MTYSRSTQKIYESHVKILHIKYMNLGKDFWLHFQSGIALRYAVKHCEGMNAEITSPKGVRQWKSMKWLKSLWKNAV